MKRIRINVKLIKPDIQLKQAKFNISIKNEGIFFKTQPIRLMILNSTM